MSDTDITDNDAPLEPAQSETDDSLLSEYKSEPRRRGVGLGVIVPLFLLAGLGGAVGGWALTQYVMPNYIPLPQAEVKVAEAPKVNLTPLNSRIDSLEKKLAAQSSEISFLSSTVKSGAATVTVGGVDEALDITPLLNRLDELEARLEKQAEANAREGAPNSIATPDMASPAPTPTIDPLPVKSYDMEIADLERRLDVLEDELDRTRSLAATPTVVRETVLLPSFPRDAMLEAMVAPRHQEAQGWLGKTLKKHISVRNPAEVARADETLDTIEALIASQDYGAALELVEAMPSDVRSIANEWIRAVKADINTRP